MGMGAPCAVCDVIITPAEFAQDGTTPRLGKFHAHPRCFAAWDLERTEGAP
jgi:hypothetical protein